ncbi:hypothetical protein LWF15_19900 [Kineosporia rhizophila]|uniref:hypothetical protein n=1 Tax=Kineosporia rhizophila TaxID=84633 RepID=UPI001E42E395|nr:hypothetical protein [Kineosporia rhizophila]MCE0537760.1 hypothetical protein [Kineosporia rhizophila]
MPFLLGLIAFLHFDVLGEVYVVELILSGIIINEMIRRRKDGRGTRRAAFVKYIPKWSPMILYAIIVVQLFRSPELLPAAKGFLLYAFFLINVSGLVILLRDDERKARQLVYGFICSVPLSFVVQPNAYMLGDPWKFAFALPAMLLVATLCWKASRMWMASLALAGVGFISMILNARSTGGICIAAALVVLMYGAESVTLRAYAKTVLTPALLIVAVSGYMVYAHLANSGQLGIEMQWKYNTQSEGDLGVLAGGRPEVFYTSAALIHDPLIGYGYKPELTDDLSQSARDSMLDLGYRSLALRSPHPGVDLPTHSYIFGAWVMFGLAGLVFWLGIMKHLARNLQTVVRSRRGSMPLCVLLAGLTSWNVFFSPFGSTSRMLAAMAIVVIGISAARAEGEEKNDHYF